MRSARWKAYKRCLQTSADTGSLPEGQESGPAEFDFSTWPRFFSQNSNGSFCQNSDEQKPKRVKTIHVQGLVAQVELVPVEDSQFTGIYGSGTDTAVLRISETGMLTEDSPGHHPSVAIKFLIDGIYS